LHITKEGIERIFANNEKHKDAALLWLKDSWEDLFADSKRIEEYIIFCKQDRDVWADCIKQIAQEQELLKEINARLDSAPKDEE